MVRLLPIIPDCRCLIIGGDFSGEEVIAICLIPKGSVNVFAPDYMGVVRVQFDCWGVRDCDGERSAIREDLLIRIDPPTNAKHEEKERERVAG